MAGFEKQPPPGAMSDHMLRGHLRFLHGTYTEPSLGRESLDACHRMRHRDPDPPYDIAHAHAHAHAHVHVHGSGRS